MSQKLAVRVVIQMMTSLFIPFQYFLYYVFFIPENLKNVSWVAQTPTAFPNLLQLPKETNVMLSRPCRNHARKKLTQTVFIASPISTATDSSVRRIVLFAQIHCLQPVTDPQNADITCINPVSTHGFPSTLLAPCVAQNSKHLR